VLNIIAPSKKKVSQRVDFSLKNRDHSAHEIDSRSSNNERHELSLKTDVYLMVAITRIFPNEWFYTRFPLVHRHFHYVEPKGSGTGSRLIRELHIVEISGPD